MSVYDRTTECLARSSRTPVKDGIGAPPVDLHFIVRRDRAFDAFN
jgi:hypothetical protein